MDMPTASTYGVPPVSLTAIGSGNTVGTQAQHPLIKWGFSAYAIILIAIAAVYFLRGRKL